jgi:glucosamine-6-phosphate deaminase
MPIEVIVERDADQVSDTAAKLLAQIIRDKPQLKAVLATGNTPMGAYHRLSALQAAGEVDARGLTIFQLDAYLGIKDDDPRSLYSWMDRSFVVPLQVPATQIVRFPEEIQDPAGECVAFAKQIEAAGGFDLAVLGLGPNGHLGFNEPPSPAQATTRVVRLTPESVASNAVYWGGEDKVPLDSLTVGMDALLAARKIVLIVLGAHKHDILRQTVEGPVTPDVPASFLQQASDVTIIADNPAWTGRN